MLELGAVDVDGGPTDASDDQTLGRLSVIVAGRW